VNHKEILMNEDSSTTGNGVRSESGSMDTAHKSRMNLDGQGEQGSAVPNVELWSRQGFVGEICVVDRPYPTFGYTTVSGPHAPHRLTIADLELPDRDDPSALPAPFMRSVSGVVLSASGRRRSTPWAIRNVECDEIHYIQDGEIDYVTDFGTITVSPGDFLHLPRAITYRVVPRSESTLSVIIETPEAAKLAPPAPFGMINLSASIKRPDPSRSSAEPGETTLLVKSFDGATVFTKPNDPMAIRRHLGGTVPVWKVNLRDVSPLTYVPHGGPPAHFLHTPSMDLLLYTLSARPGARPPLHHNADYDEVIFYVGGDDWGKVTEPGTLTWVPKGVTHWGPREDTNGHLAWLLEVGGTLRFTEAGLDAADLMETDQYAVHPAAARRTRRQDEHTTATELPSPVVSS
jgi:homogentisate 1,2-dioxygenase